MMGRSFGGGLVLALALAGAAQAQQWQQVQPHVRRDGTYVPQHYRTAPDNSRLNNWSTPGNTNPFTGQRGSDSAPRPQYRPPAFTPR